MEYIGEELDSARRQVEKKNRQLDDREKDIHALERQMCGHVKEESKPAPTMMPFQPPPSAAPFVMFSYLALGHAGESPRP